MNYLAFCSIPAMRYYFIIASIIASCHGSASTIQSPQHAALIKKLDETKSLRCRLIRCLTKPCTDDIFELAVPPSIAVNPYRNSKPITHIVELTINKSVELSAERIDNLIKLSFSQQILISPILHTIFGLSHLSNLRIIMRHALPTPSNENTVYYANKLLTELVQQKHSCITITDVDTRPSWIIKTGLDGSPLPIELQGLYKKL